MASRGGQPWSVFIGLALLLYAADITLYCVFGGHASMTMVSLRGFLATCQAFSISTTLFTAAVSALSVPKRQSSDPPTVQVLNGSYYGVYSPTYDQDFFLGMPYAQPPLGNLRLQRPQPLATSWNDTKNATEYSPECYGYGSDDWVIGNILSEDCLTINVVRPSGVQPGAGLPVVFWIHGGGFTEGGGRDPRYNYSSVVQESVQMGSPIIAVSINYRLSGWGFLWGQEVAAAGTSNLGLRDQRLALHWVQENIASFGGDPSKVVIQGESAGAMSVGAHLAAYGGRDDGLFRGAIAESGAPVSPASYVNASAWQPYYDTVVNATNCSAAVDTLQCLRTVPTEILSNVFNSTALAVASFLPAVDGDFITIPVTQLLSAGHFVRVPFLIGTNSDEGTAFGTQGINTTAEFIEDVLTSGPNISQATAETIAALYPDIPEIGVPSTLHGRPPPGTQWGTQWKRAAAYGGDTLMQAPRRFTTQIWATYSVPCYSYRFNVLVNGLRPEIGATHFQEVAFVFNNIHGLGYGNAAAADPFANEPATFPQLAALMSSRWINFVNSLDPNNISPAANNTTTTTTTTTGTTTWPIYTLDDPRNIVFDVNVTGLSFVEPDIYRAEGIAFIMSRWSDYGR